MLPDLDAVTAYLGDYTSYTPEQIQSALDAETAAQAKLCTIPAEYPADLADALCRRVARNLAVRALPLGFQASLSEASVAIARVGGTDPEIRRLEAPYRRRFVG